MNFRLWVATASVIVFGGCASNVFSPDAQYEAVTYYTKKQDISTSLEQKALIVATYLNNIEKKYQNGEYYAVGVFIDDDNKDEDKAGLLNPTFTLKLNGQDGIIERIITEDDDNEFRTYPFYNRWSTYYVVKFPTVSTNAMTLNYSHSKYGVATLSFVKE